MKSAFGALQWPPETFWRATMTEFVVAIDAFNAMHGAEKAVEAPSGDEMAELLARYG